MQKNKRYVVQIQFQVYAKDDESVVADSERILADLRDVDNERILSIDENSWGSFDLREIDVSEIRSESLKKELSEIQYK